MNCFDLAFNVVMFAVTYEPSSLVESIKDFKDLTDEAIEFYNGLPNPEEYADFDKIFIDLDDLWPELEKVTKLIDDLKVLLAANGTVKRKAKELRKSERTNRKERLLKRFQ